MSRYVSAAIAESFLRRLALGNVLAEDGDTDGFASNPNGVEGQLQGIAVGKEKFRPERALGQRTAIERRQEPHSFLVEPGLSGAFPNVGRTPKAASICLRNAVFECDQAMVKIHHPCRVVRYFRSGLRVS